MAQGQIKKSKAPGASKKVTPKQLAAQHKARVAKPKKTSIIQQQKLLKKHTSGLTALTEKNLASKAGHLEMLGTKKGSGKNDGKGHTKSSAKAGKGKG